MVMQLKFRPSNPVSPLDIMMATRPPPPFLLLMFLQTSRSIFSSSLPLKFPASFFLMAPTATLVVAITVVAKHTVKEEEPCGGR